MSPKMADINFTTTSPPPTTTPSPPAVIVEVVIGERGVEAAGLFIAASGGSGKSCGKIAMSQRGRLRREVKLPSRMSEPTSPA